jgi:hypothetical protein
MNSDTTIAPAVVKHIQAFFHESHRPAIVRDERGRIGFWNFDKSHFIVEFSDDAEAQQCLRNPRAFYGSGGEDALGLGYFN